MIITMSRWALYAPAQLRAGDWVENGAPCGIPTIYGRFFLMIIVQCAWCEISLGAKDSKARKPEKSLVSHSICDQCGEVVLNKGI